MNDIKHTKGPWHAEDIFVGYGDTEEGINGIVSGCSPELSREELRANANLIAAAPELLDSLQELLESAEMVTLTTGKNNAPKKIIRARKAIAKAKGEQC